MVAAPQFRPIVTSQWTRARALLSRHRREALLTSVFVLAAAVVVSRRPEALTQPQLYAEDGQTWYADAHNLGVRSLVLPLGGYLNTLQRIVGFACAWMPMRSAALTFAVVSLCMQVLPALIFASGRFRTAVRSDTLRAFIALLYIVIPNPELTGNLTNAHWHLAVAALLVLIGPEPRTRAGRAFNVSVLAVSGLSGPFALFLLPIGAWWNRQSVRGFRRFELATVAGAALVQLLVLVPSVLLAPRDTAPLGASITNFALIVTNQLVARFTAHAFGTSLVVVAGAVTAGVVVVLVLGWLRGSRQLRPLILFAAAIAISGMTLPYDRFTQTRSAWQMMATGGAGTRYFFLMALAVALSLVAAASALRQRWYVGARWFTVGACAFVVVASAGAWRYTPLADEDLDHYQTVIDHSTPGTVVTIPIDPAGWSMAIRAG